MKRQRRQLVELKRVFQIPTLPPVSEKRAWQLFMPKVTICHASYILNLLQNCKRRSNDLLFLSHNSPFSPFSGFKVHRGAVSREVE